MELNMIVPTEAINALRTIREDYPDAFIAGGYLRDLYHGKPPKDLDIFTFGGPKEDETGYDLREYLDEPRITFLANREGFFLPLQIIFLDKQEATTPAAAAAQFALGLQQVWYCGDKVEAHEVFYEDSNNHWLTVTRCRNPEEAWHIQLKVNALKLKYPGFVLRPSTEYTTYLGLYGASL